MPISQAKQNKIATLCAQLYELLPDPKLPLNKHINIKAGGNLKVGEAVTISNRAPTKSPLGIAARNIKKGDIVGYAPFLC